MRLRNAVVAAVAGAVALGPAACGQGSSPGAAGGSGSSTVKVAYQRFGPGRVMDNFLAGVKTRFEKANPGKKVVLQPIVASENDYYTKLALMLRSPRTSPDVVYEDTFLINSDIKAGYLKPLDGYLSSWPEWSQFQNTAKGAARAQDGKTYGVPDGTDTRALWYDKQLFAKAGLPVPWQPRTWDDVLQAARTVKAKLPGVVPMNLYSGKAQGEAATMQGFEMLLYGTGSTLYDQGAKKWVTGSRGFTDSLQFVKTVYGEGLGPTVQQALDPNIGVTVQTQWLPKGKIAMDLDGSWVSSNWVKGGAAPWPQWSKVMGQAPMPTQHGQAPGRVSMSGGWTWAVSAKSGNPDLAWKLVSSAVSKQNNVEYATKGVQIAVRKDVAQDASYTGSNPSFAFFSSLVPVTTYRPALPEYPRISNEIQVAMEGVMTNQTSPDAAAKAYDEALKGIVGADATKSGS